VTSKLFHRDLIPFAQLSRDGSDTAHAALLKQGDVVLFAYGNKSEDEIKLRNVLVDISAKLAGTLTPRKSERPLVSGQNAEWK